MTLINDVYGRDGRSRGEKKRRLFSWKSLRPSGKSTADGEDLFIADCAPSNEYVILRKQMPVADGTVKNHSTLEVKFLEKEPVSWKNFLYFLFTSCILCLAIVAVAYFVRGSGHASSLYAAASSKEQRDSQSPLRVPTMPIGRSGKVDEIAIPMRVATSSASHRGNALKELTSGTLDEQISALDVRGVQVAAYSARALIGNRIVHQGDHLYIGSSELIFRGVDGENMLFEDGNGQLHQRSLRPTAGSSLH
ncbi:MAG: hypothetical protein LBI69_04960 [Puniceicoccales bacterium]|jgi:hypothetical protein|nr:hypothetical protein [Puniceicoccales bacterium]